MASGSLATRDQLRKSLDFLFSSLLSEGKEGELAWREFAYRFGKDSVRLGEALPRNVEDSARIELLAALLIVLARGAYADIETRSRFFAAGEGMGFHLLPATFYSPIPQLSKLDERVWSERFPLPGFEDASRQLSLLRTLAASANEFAEGTKDDGPAGSYRRDNLSFGLMDASVYYAVIQHYRPAKVMEVGGGQSTLVAEAAARRLGTTDVYCIEPEPSQELAANTAIRVRRAPVQSVPISEFAQLSSNDILFVDGTHVSKVGSDVNYVVLKVLPELAPGVIVHFHDVFLPFEYPKHWFENQLFWNEQYLLAAMLGSTERFEVLIGNHFLAVTQKSVVGELLPSLPLVGGVSLWLRKRDNVTGKGSTK